MASRTENAVVRVENGLEVRADGYVNMYAIYRRVPGGRWEFEAGGYGQAEHAQKHIDGHLRTVAPGHEFQIRRYRGGRAESYRS